MTKILITGAAGFIGFHLVEKLIKNDNWDIVGLDNINDYYDVKLKYDRLNESGISFAKIIYNNLVISKKSNKYRFVKLDLVDKVKIMQLFVKEKFDYVVNLAAQAGVRYSLENPDSYIQSNIVGFLNILEGCRFNNIKHLIYASSSSVYGANIKTPFSTSDNVDHPISLYAATKKSNELMAHTYSHLYNIPVTGLRFFTVYGPWGRPDMATFLFAKAIATETPLKVFNFGQMKRDFTYISDIIDSLYRLIEKAPICLVNNSRFQSTSSVAKYRLFNIGNSNPVELNYFINILEKELGKKAKRNYLPMQPGDLSETYASVDDLKEYIGFSPKLQIEDGLHDYIKWFKSYYKYPLSR